MPIMAAKNTSVALGEPFIEFALRKLESGEFATTSEVVREAMRRHVAEDIPLQALRDAIRAGLESGSPEPFDFDHFPKEILETFMAAAGLVPPCRRARLRPPPPTSSTRH